MAIKDLFSKILLTLACIHAMPVFAENLSVFADLLVWQASQETSSSWASVATSNANHTIQFKAPDISFHYNLGFRGGFTAEPKNFASSKFYWTYFQTHQDGQLKNQAQLVFPEFFSGFVSGNFFFNGSIDWKLLMNMFDYELGTKFTVGNAITLRPNIGIKAGTINQAVNCLWLADIYTATESVKHNYFGVGPKFGIDSTWLIFKNLHVFGDFSAALMYGRWRIKDIYSRPYAAGGLVQPANITTSLDKCYLGTIVLDYFMGIEYVHKGRSNVALKIGYEMQFWANQLRIPTFQQLPLRGDLTFQGATCRVIIDL